MQALIICLVLIMIIIFTVIIVYLYIHKRISNFTSKYFGTSDLKEALEKSTLLSAEIPKSLSNMEPLILNQIEKDFPDLNINELKSMAEKEILECFNSIEKQNTENIANDKVKSWLKSIISDLRNQKIYFDNIKFHRTVVNNYEKSKGIATIYLQTSLEYFYKIDDAIGKKIQDRVKTEFIYIIDASKVAPDKKTLGLNCPNCGATITSLGEKVCHYCGTGIKDLVKRTWILNNINKD